MSEWVEVEVTNWEKYNPRSDRKSHSWFRLENNIASEPKFFGLKPAQKFAAICIFAEVSKNRGMSTRINISWLSSLVEISVSEIHKTILHLTESGVLRSPTGNQAVSGGITTYDTNERTNDTNVHDQKLNFDFEKIYRVYPRKIGKQKGIEKAKREIQTQEDYIQLENAVRRFVEHHKSKKTEEQYILHFSSFMSIWRDWGDPETGSAEDFGKKDGIDWSSV